MTLSFLFFCFLALLLIALLVFASRPSNRQFTPPADVFEALSQSRHCSRLPQIVLALRPEDTEYLRESGQVALMQALRRQRRRIALNYLNELQQEFEMLLEISRVLAVMSPDAVGMEEMERWRLSVTFATTCAFLRWKLRLGLQPFSGFNLLSNMASNISLELDTATARIAEATVRGSAHPR